MDAGAKGRIDTPRHLVGNQVAVYRYQLPVIVRVELKYPVGTVNHIPLVPRADFIVVIFHFHDNVVHAPHPYRIGVMHIALRIVVIRVVIRGVPEVDNVAHLRIHCLRPVHVGHRARQHRIGGMVVCISEIRVHVFLPLLAAINALSSRVAVIALSIALCLLLRRLPVLRHVEHKTAARCQVGCLVLCQLLELQRR